MDRNGIKYKTSGFLQDAAYTADLLMVINKHLDGYTDLEELFVELFETPKSTMGIIPDPYPIVFSENGKKCTLKLRQHKLYDKRGKPYSQPDPYEVFQHIRFMLDRMKKEHKEKFNQEQNEQPQI
jgi:hypothetical protein